MENNLNLYNMYDKNNMDEDGNNYDYYPNELAELSKKNPDKYRSIIESNLEPGDTVEQWEQRNLKRMQNYLKK